MKILRYYSGLPERTIKDCRSIVIKYIYKGIHCVWVHIICPGYTHFKGKLGIGEALQENAYLKIQSSHYPRGTISSYVNAHERVVITSILPYHTKLSLEPREILSGDSITIGSLCKEKLLLFVLRCTIGELVIEVLLLLYRLEVDFLGCEGNSKELLTTDLVLVKKSARLTIYGTLGVELFKKKFFLMSFYSKAKDPQRRNIKIDSLICFSPSKIDGQASETIYCNSTTFLRNRAHTKMETLEDKYRLERKLKIFTTNTEDETI
ncbi:hypothetical protein H8356DRAFT_1362653 [Neocallimastix lanati (nom. inval.)]|nr:hypothetical protein H8356DRAFT_1362653 [Neocallimastix sp. JGI-2020a]